MPFLSQQVHICKNTENYRGWVFVRIFLQIEIKDKKIVQEAELQIRKGKKGRIK